MCLVIQTSYKNCRHIKLTVDYCLTSPVFNGRVAPESKRVAQFYLKEDFDSIWLLPETVEWRKVISTCPRKLRGAVKEKGNYSIEIGDCCSSDIDRQGWEGGDCLKTQYAPTIPNPYIGSAAPAYSGMSPFFMYNRAYDPMLPKYDGLSLLKLMRNHGAEFM